MGQGRLSYKICPDAKGLKIMDFLFFKILRLKNKNKKIKYTRRGKKGEERRESTRGQGCGPIRAAENPLPADAPFNEFTRRTPGQKGDRN